MAEDEDWHLDKKVPISIIIALVLQTFGFVAIGSAWKAGVESRLPKPSTFSAATSPTA